MSPSSRSASFLLLMMACTGKSAGLPDDDSAATGPTDTGPHDSAEDTDSGPDTDTDTAEDTDTGQETDPNIDPACPWVGDAAADRKFCADSTLEMLFRATTADVDGQPDEDLLFLTVSSELTTVVRAIKGPLGEGTSRLADTHARISGHEFSGATDMAFGDVTGDGTLDVVITELAYRIEDVARGPVTILSTPLEGELSLDDAPLYFDFSGTIAYSGFGIMVEDFDHDGQDDVVTTSVEVGDPVPPGTPMVSFHMGPIVAPEPYDGGDVVWTFEEWGYSCDPGSGARASDLDGDGIMDMAVPCPDLGVVHIVPGPITPGIGRESAIELGGSGPDSDDLIGRIEIGDEDGDGYADVMLPYHEDRTYWHPIKRGPILDGDRMSDAERSVQIQWDDDYDSSLFIADQDGDGGEEIVLTAAATEWADRYENVYVVRSGGTGTMVLDDEAPDWVFRGESDDGDAYLTPDRAGDLNGDGFDDFVITDSRSFYWSAPDESYAYIFFGPLF